MLKGIISRRSSQRIPFQTKIGIQFDVADKGPITAITTNLNSSGVRFFVPKGQIKLAPDENIELVFNLPEQKEILIKGEVSYFSNAFDVERNPVIYYGVKFLDLSAENWEAINTFINSQQDTETTNADPAETEASPKAEVNPEIITTPISTNAEKIVETIEQDPGPNLVATPETNADEMVLAFDPHNLPPAEAMRHLNQSSIDQLVQLLTRPKQATTKPATTTPLAGIDEEPTKSQTVATEISSTPPEVQPTAAPELTHEAELTNTGLEDLAQPLKPTASVNPAPTKPEFILPDGLEQIQSIAASINLDLDKELFGSDLLTNEELNQGLSLPNSLVDLNADDSGATLLPQSSLIDMLYGDNAANSTTQPKPAGTKPQIMQKLPADTTNSQLNKAEPTIGNDQKPTAASIRQKMIDQIVTNQVQNKTVSPPPPTGPKLHNPINPEPKPNIPTISQPKPIPTKPSTLSMNQQMIDQIIQSLQQK